MTNIDFHPKNYNPDILSCLANLSNDEVFTPPELANKMLDILPQGIFRDKSTTFLDPACKSGVFLREIAKRLLVGLESEFPDLQSRIDHIFHRQLYGIAITELTSLLTRRTVYCSKYPNSDYSISKFGNSQGNIRYKNNQHIWKDQKCIFCGVSRPEYERNELLETHAYEFIHNKNPMAILNMKFDVIIGNPPYQLGSNDQRSTRRDIPIYQHFVTQAKNLNPRYLCMIIPSRWMASGLGLNEFRNSMLTDKHIRTLVDYPAAKDIFAGVEIKGGVCYFLWDRDNEGDCNVTLIRDNIVVGPDSRNLSEFDIFVRDIRALNILHKVLAKKEQSIIEILSVDKEFGWTSNFNGFHEIQNNGDIPLYYYQDRKRQIGWIERSNITKSTHLIDKWKVMVPQAGSDGGAKIPDVVLSSSFIVTSPSVCTQTYLFFYVDSEIEAKSIQSYIQTRFFRFLVSLRKITQHATRSTYTWVPQQNWSESLTDEFLYDKYNLTADEIKFIESMIRSI